MQQQVVLAGKLYAKACGLAISYYLNEKSKQIPKLVIYSGKQTNIDSRLLRRIAICRFCGCNVEQYDARVNGGPF